MFAMGPGFFRAANAPSYDTLTITGTFPGGTVGTAYDEFVTISGGETPYTLTGGTGVASGSLPAGLSLSIQNADELHLSGTPTAAETANFTDSVDSADGQTATSAQSVAVASVITDPHWPNVTSLLPCTGAAGSTSFPDAKGFGWTAYGDTKISSSQKLFGENMAYFDGASDYLVGAAGAFNFHGQDYTWEAFVNTTQASNNVIASGRFAETGGWELFAQAGKTLILAIWNSAGYRELASTSLLPSGTTTHISVGFSATAATYYLSVGGAVTAVANANVPGSTSANAVLGADLKGPSKLAFQGYMGQQRMTLGVCRYSSSFPVPSAPFPTS